MKTKVLLIAIPFTACLFFTFCEKETPKPVIDLTELGYENSKIAYLGADLHIEAEIVAEGKISKVQVTIHPAGEHEGKGATAILHEGEWEVDTTYTKFSGLKNITFHEHIKIPVTAEKGDYHSI